MLHFLQNVMTHACRGGKKLYDKQLIYGNNFIMA